MPGNRENWKYVYKTSKALITAKTCVYFLIFDVRKMWGRKKNLRQNTQFRDVGHPIPAPLDLKMCANFDSINITAQLLEMMFKTGQVYYCILKCNHDFEAITDNNELQCWDFRLGKGRSLSLQKMSSHLKIFQYFFTWSLCSRKAVSSSCHPATGTSVYCTWSHWNKACKEGTAVSKGEGKQPLLQCYTRQWFYSVQILKIKTSQMANLHELWDYDSPVP